MKNPSDTVRNLTRDLPTRNAVPRPIAQPRAPIFNDSIQNVRQHVMFRRLVARKIQVAWCITPCLLVNRYRHFG